MKSPFKKFSIFSLLTITLLSCKEDAPEPYGALPTKAQIEWQKLEYYMFIHFGPNTFTDVEWGNGREDPKVFNPTELDCRQWAATAKAAGMKAIIITAKHHDGFCLWPSKYSTHTVRESSWKNGKGDLLEELSTACKEYDLRFGIYLSPWDQNHPSYGTPEYNQVFANTLNEVLVNYGNVFEQWFDGANGEGKEERKQIYDWNLFNQTVHKNQPDAIIFSDVGPGCRWMGNEKGIAGETNWATINVEGFEPGNGAPSKKVLSEGEVDGRSWIPTETDVSIRPGWFYSPSTDNKVKTLEQLMDIYYTSVGRNSNLLLNVPPDRRGKIYPADSLRLMQFREAITAVFDENLMLGSKIKASNTRRGFPADNIIDGNYDTYWATKDDVLSASLEIELKGDKTFNRLLLQEYIPLGQRVSAIRVKYWNKEKSSWSDLTEATTIGYKRILCFPSITSDRVKIELDALACPVINKIGIYNAPELKVNDTFHSKAQSNLSPKQWSIISPSGDFSNAIDGDKNTFVQIKYDEPFSLDLKTEYTLYGFSYTPHDNNQSPNIFRYDLHVSEDGHNWKEIKKNTLFNNIKNNPDVQDVIFEKPIKGRYIKLQPTELTVKKDKYIIAEFNIIVER